MASVADRTSLAFARLVLSEFLFKPGSIGAYSLTDTFHGLPNGTVHNILLFIVFQTV